MPSSFYHLYEKLKNSSGGASGTSSAPSKSTPVSVTTPLGIYSKPGLVLPSATVSTNPVNAIATPLGVYTNSMLYPVAGIRSTPTSTSGVWVDTDNPKQVNSIYDLLSHTYQTLTYSVFRQNYKYYAQDPRDAYYIKKYKLEEYLQNLGQYYTWKDNRRLWKEYLTAQVAQPFKRLADETIPFKSRISNFGGHILFNMLPSFGETADYFSNIVKAALPTNLTRWEEKYPELKGMSTKQRIMSGLFGLEAAKGIEMGEAIQYITRPYKSRTSEKTEESYRTIADTIRKNKLSNRTNTFSRYTFDFDINLDDDPEKTNVGEFILNMVGEIFTDPLNILEIGSKIADAVGGNKAILKALTRNGDDIYNEAIPELIKNGTLKWDSSTAKWFDELKAAEKIDQETLNAFRRIGYNAMQEGDDLIAAKSFKDILLNTKAKKDILSKLQSISSKGALRDALYGIDRDEFLKAFESYMKSQNFSESTLRLFNNNPEAINILGGKFFDVLSEALTHKVNFRILAGIHGLGEGADLIDDIIIKLAGLPVMTPVVMLTKTFGGRFIRYIGSTVIRKLAKHQYIKEGVDLGAKIFDYDDIVANMKKSMEALQLANADLKMEPAEAAKHMTAEMAAKSLDAQVAYFNSALRNLVKKYPLSDCKNPEKYAEFVEEVKKLCKIFTKNSSNPAKAAAVKDVRDFIAYFDDLLKTHPELQMYVTPSSLTSLEYIARLEVKADGLAHLKTDTFYSAVQNIIAYKDIDLAGRGSIKKAARDIIGWSGKAEGNQINLFDFFDIVMRYMRGQSNDIGDLAKKISKALIGDHKNIAEVLKDAGLYDVTKMISNTRNITYVEDNIQSIKALQRFFSTFNYDDVDKGFRETLIKYFEDLGELTKYTNDSLNSINNLFDILKTKYNTLQETCKRAYTLVTPRGGIMLNDEGVTKYAGIIKNTYGALWSDMDDFLEVFQNIRTKYVSLQDHLLKGKEDFVIKLNLFTFLKDTHESFTDAFAKITELFGNNSYFIKQANLPETLYNATLKDIRQMNTAEAGIVLPSINSFIQHSDDLTAALSEFSEKFPNEYAELIKRHGDPITILKKYFNKNQNINLEDLKFSQLNQFTRDLDKWASNFEEDLLSFEFGEAFNSTLKSMDPIFKESSESLSNSGIIEIRDYYKEIYKMRDELRRYRNTIKYTDAMFESKLPFYADIDKTQAWVRLRMERMTELLYILKNPLTVELSNLWNGVTNTGKLIKRVLKDESFQKAFPGLKDALIDVKRLLDTHGFIEDVITEAETSLSAPSFKSFLETFMNFSEGDLNNFLDPNYQYAFYNKMCINMDGKKNSPKRASLDAFRTSGIIDKLHDKGELTDDLWERIRNKGHVDPGSDTLALKYKIKYDTDTVSVRERINTYAKANPKKDIKLFDIETVYDSNAAVMTANRHGGRVIQISLTDYNTNETKVYRLAFDKNGNVLNYGDAPNATKYSSMFDLLKAFDDDLKNTGLLLGMNSSRFDAPFLRDQWIAENIDAFKDSNLFKLLYDKKLRIVEGGGHCDVYRGIQLHNKAIPDAFDDDAFTTISDLLIKVANGAKEHKIRKLGVISGHEVTRVANELKRCIDDGLKDTNNLNFLKNRGERLANWIRNFNIKIDTFKEDSLHANFKNMLYRDLTQETVTEIKINELIRLSKMQDNPTQLYELLRKEAHLTNAEFNLLLNGKLDTDPITQAKLHDAWVRRMYFYGSNSDSITDFSEQTYKAWTKGVNLSDPRTLQRILMDSDKNVRINYKKVFTPDGFNVVLNTAGKSVSIFNTKMLNDLYILTDENTLANLRNVAKRIKDITEHQIKQPEAILNLKIFNSKEDLIAQTEKLINDLKPEYGVTPWLRFIDLNAFKDIDTTEHWFALWYVLITDAHAYTTVKMEKYFEEMFGSKLAYIDTSTALNTYFKNPSQEFMAYEFTLQNYIKENVFNRISETIFNNNDLLYLLDDDTALAHPLYDLFEADLWQSYTGAQRLDKASAAIDYIGKGGAKEYARAAIMQNMRKIISDINKMSEQQQIAYVQTFAQQINKITGALNLRFLIMANESAESIVADLLYHNGVRILHMDPNLPNSDYTKLCNNLLTKQEEYLKYGVQITYDKTRSNIYLTLAKGDLSTDINSGKISYMGREIEPPKPPVIQMTDYSGIIPTDHLDLYTKIMYRNTELFEGNYLGRALNQEDFDDWIKDNLPERLNYAKNSLDLRELSEYNFYRGANLRMCEVFDPDAAANLDYIPYSQTIHSFFNNYRHMLNAETGQELFFDFMLSPTYGMSFKNTEGIFKGLSEKEILQVIKNTDDYVPISIVRDNSIQGFHVVRLQINTVNDVRQARELNAMLVPYQVYSSCFDEINNTIEATFNRPTTARGKSILYPNGEPEIDSNGKPILNAKDIKAYVKTKPLYYARIGLWMYKVGSLIYPGTTLRNLIDSNLKAAIDTGAPIETIRNNFRAMDMMHRYNETIKQFIDLYGRNNPRTPTPSMLKDAYKKFAEVGIVPKMDQDEFLFLHNFIINGPSTGETKVLRDWFSTASELAKQESAGFFQRFADTMLQPMGLVETYARLGQYLTLMEQGITKTEAFTRISKTAFDYNIKSNTDKFIEYFLPFFNFQKLNAMYWAETFYKHPMAIRLLNDFTKYSWQTFDYDEDYYMSEKSKAYHMLNGNLMVDPASGMVLKLNPSYMDALNWLYDPTNSVIDSLLAPLQNYVNGLMDNDEERFVQQQIEDGTYIIRVGKYKGFTVNEVLEKDPGYLQFALDKEWFQTYDRAAYQSAMLKLTGTPMSITFGDKFNGQPVSVLLKDENRGYAQYLMTQQWFKDLYKPVYDYLVLNKVYEDPVMPWGKFEGKKISEVPKWYFDYIMQNDWMYESYGYLADAIIENRNTIVPLSEIDFDSKATFADAAGKIAAGVFIEDNEQANIYLKSILDMFNQASTYPVIGPFIQKYITSIFKDEQGIIPYNSSARTNDTRLSKRNAPNEAMLGAVLPDIFGSVTLYERYKQEEAIDYSKASPHVSKYRPQDYNDRRNRHHNYYRSGRAERYRTYHKHVKPSLDVAQLRLGIAQLHLGV